jgi:exosortase A
MTVQEQLASPVDSRSTMPTASRQITADPKIVVAAFLIVVGAASFALFDTISGIVATWYDSVTFNHGFLIVPICIYLVWQRRSEIAATPFAPEWRGLLLVGLASAGWLLGAVSGTLVVQQFAVVAIFQATVLTMFGRRLTKLLQFPLLYLYFAVPFGLALVPPLQDVTARFSVGLLKLAGVPVFVDGNMIAISTGNFLVAEACSGIRYLIASIALGVLLGGLIYRSWWRRAFFLLLSVVVPVVANGIRAFGIILIAHLTNNEYATGIDHIFYGWVFFTLVTFVLLAIGMMMSEAEEPAFQRPTVAATINVSMRPVIMVAALAVACVWTAKAYADYVNRSLPVGVAALVSPSVTQPWHPVAGAADPMQPKFFGADAVLSRAYDAGNGVVYLHVGYYAYQRHGAEAVSSLHELAHDSKEIPNAVGKISQVVAGESLSIDYSRIQFNHGGRLIWYWYWVDGQFTGNPYWAKLLQLKAKLLRGPQAAAVVMIAADYRELPGEAQKRLGDFLAQVPAVLPVLKAARGG